MKRPSILIALSTLLCASVATHAERVVQLIKDNKIVAEYPIDAIDRLDVYEVLEAPTGVKAAVNASGEVVVTWSAVDGAEAYEVVRSAKADGTYTPIASGVQSTAAIDDRPLTGDNYYKVMATAEGKLSRHYSEPASVNVSGGALPTIGDGTWDSPYTCADILAMDPSTSIAGATVRGYIVGYVVGNTLDASSAKFSAVGAGRGNVIIADRADETDYLNCAVVQLSSGTDARKYVNLADYPDNLGATLTVTGTVGAAYGRMGVKSPTAYEISGK